MAVQGDFEDDGGVVSDGAGAGGCCTRCADRGWAARPMERGSRYVEYGLGVEVEQVFAQARLDFAVHEAVGVLPATALPATTLNALTELQTDGLGYEDSVDLLEAASKLASAAEALKARAVSRVSETAADRVVEENVIPSGPAVERLADGVAVSEIASLLDLSGQGTRKLITESGSLTGELPATLEALAEGRINPQQAGVIVDQCGSLPPEAVGSFEEEMVAFAPGRARHLLAAKARRMRERLHPETIRKRKAKAARDRTVLLEGAGDGMAWLSAYLPAEAATAAYHRVTAAAKQLQGADEGRNLAQLRADVFADLLHTGRGTGGPPAALNETSMTGNGAKSGQIGGVNGGNGATDTDTSTAGGANAGAGGHADGHAGGAVSLRQIIGAAAAGAAAAGGTMPIPGTGPAGPSATAEAGGSDGGRTIGGDPVHPGSGRVPDYAGIKAEVMVVVPVLTLMGLSDEPADLEGCGPVDEDTARRLAARAPSFKRLLTHPESGALLSYGQGTYQVPEDLKRFVKLRDRTCRGPGCNKAARFCDVDHTIPYPAGGTDEWNLKGLCRPTHILKTAGLWRDTQHRNGRIDWTSPAGRHYSNTPEGPLPEMRPINSTEEVLKMANRPHGLLRPLPAEPGGPTDPPADTPTKKHGTGNEGVKAAKNRKSNRNGSSNGNGEPSHFVDPWQTPPTNTRTGKQAISDGQASNDPQPNDPDELPPF